MRVVTSTVGYGVCIAFLLATAGAKADATPITSMWSGEQAMNDIATQLSFGTRALGTLGHQKATEFIKNQLASTSSQVVTQQGTYQGTDGKEHPLTNIIARFDPSNPRRLIVGTHYDSNIRAYADPTNPDAPMPGANNSASGVALLLETARVLDKIQRSPVGVDFVFFDGEEGPRSLGAGDPHWYPLGSPFFAQHLNDLYQAYPEGRPEQAIIFDMVCEKNLHVSPELSSLPSAFKKISAFWDIGRTVVPSAFLPTPLHYPIGDDHTALIGAGIPSFLVIDFDYARWFNTTQDTLDKCLPLSLQEVGRTLLQYLFTR